MRHNPRLPLIALPCLLALPTNAQTTLPTTGKESSPAIASQIKKSYVPVAKGWAKAFSWQKAPDEFGEFLMYPNPADQEEFLWGKRRLVTTEMGLMYRDEDGPWKLVPGLYKQPVRIARESQGQLWVESAEQGLLAFDLNWNIVRRFPTVKGHCIAIESQGFWCLEEFGYDVHYFYYTHGIYPLAKALVEYDLEGKEKRRFVPRKLNLVSSTTPVDPEATRRHVGEDSINWAAVDSDAIWVSVENYRWEGPYPTHPPRRYGETQLGRLDRATGEWKIFPWPHKEEGGYSHVPRDLLNLPNCVQWLSLSSREAVDIYQLDKRTLQTSRASRIPLLSNSSIKTEGKNLWIQRQSENSQQETRVYSRETFDPIAPREADTALPNSFSPQPSKWNEQSPFRFWLEPVAEDDKGIWLTAPSSRLLYAGDDGNLMSYSVEDLLTFTQNGFASHTPPGQLLWTGSEQLIRLQPNGKATQLSLSSEWLQGRERAKQTLKFLSATQERVWYYTDKGRLVTLEPNLSKAREIKSSLLDSELSSDRLWNFSHGRGYIAVGNDLYLWGKSGYLLKVSGTTGKVSIVESWMKPVSAEDQTSPHRELNDRNQDAFALPDGSIAFRFVPKVVPRSGMSQWGEELDKARIFIFNPVKDTWKESNASFYVEPLPAGQKLYGYDGTRLHQWQGDSWIVLGSRPLVPVTNGGFAFSSLGFNQPHSTNYKVLATAKYFYQETILGLYRIPWSQLGAG